MQFDDSSRIVRYSGHMHTQRYACDRRAWRNASSDVESEHASADETQGRLAGEKVITDTIAEVAICKNVLVERVILTGINADNRRAC